MDYGIVASAAGMPDVKIGKPSVVITDVDGSTTSASPPPPPPPPSASTPPPSPSSEKSAVNTIIITVVSVVGAVLLAGGCLLAHRAKGRTDGSTGVFCPVSSKPDNNRFVWSLSRLVVIFYFGDE